LPRFGAVVTTAATPCALPSDCTSTGHVWITVRRRHGLNPHRIFSLPIESMASGLVTEAWPPGSPGMSPGIRPPSGHIARIIHKPYTQPPYLALRACSNGDDGWSETGQSDARASTPAAGAQNITSPAKGDLAHPPGRASASS
jgi:hypothetical protein